MRIFPIEVILEMEKRTIKQNIYINPLNILILEIEFIYKLLYLQYISLNNKFFKEQNHYITNYVNFTIFFEFLQDKVKVILTINFCLS